MRMTGAQAIIESLRCEEVEVVFGYPGGAVLTLYDALYEAKFPHVLTRHEQGAAHAADGYARSTGKVGVCMATSGPGATNLVTGIATAYMDSIPLVAITGQVAVPLIGRDSFQEADVRGITTPITKHNYLVKDVREIPRVMKEAFYIARTGRPGPVLIDVAKDIFAAELDFEYPEEVVLRGYRPIVDGDPELIKSVAQDLAQAKKPLIFVGGGVNLSDISPSLREMIDYAQIPVISSLMGLGSIPGDHPLNLGMVGMHGTYTANMATIDCDVLLGIGVRFDDRVTGLVEHFAPNAKLIHCDIDPAEINKNIIVDTRVVGDLRWTIPSLLEEVKKWPAEEWAGKNSEWRIRLKETQEKMPLSFTQRPNQVMPQEVIQCISKLTAGEAIVVTDVGQHQMWTAQFFNFQHPRHFLTSGGLGTMGYGLPAGMGAQVGSPDKKVVVVSGDGGFMMNCQELSTIADLNLPVKIVIINNQVLGMVSQWQRMFYNKHYAHSRLEGHADFVKLADAMGIQGMRVNRPEELETALEKALAAEGPIVVDIRIPEDEDVIPMVPAGARLDQMIIGG